MEAALAGFSQSKVGGLVVGAEAFYNANAKLLAEAALRHEVPTSYEYTEFTDAGGLMSCGGNIEESYRWAGIYAGRILKGPRPPPTRSSNSPRCRLMLGVSDAGRRICHDVPQAAGINP